MYELHLTRATGPEYPFIRDDHKDLSFCSKVGGVAKDITGATFAFEIYDRAGGTLVHTLPTTVLDGAAGTWRTSWAPADGAILLAATAMTSRILRYRIQRTLASVVTTLLAGDLEVLPRPPSGEH